MAKRRKTAISAEHLVKVREEAINAMSATLAELFRDIESRIKSAREDNIRWHYDLGKACAKLKREPENYCGLTGQSGMELVEQAVGGNAKLLNDVIRFVDSYTEDQLESMLSRENADTGYKLSWAHVKYLLSVISVSQRQAYEIEVIEKMLDPKALHDLIKRVEERSGGHGRSHEMPKTVSAQIGQIFNLTKQYVEKSQKVWDGGEVSVFNNLQELPGEEIEEVYVDKLRDVERLLVELETVVPQLIISVRDTISSMTAAAEAFQAAEAARLEEIQRENIENLRRNSSAGTRILEVG